MHRYDRITDAGYRCSQRGPYPANADDPNPQFLCHDHRPNRMLSTGTQVSPELMLSVATNHVPTTDGAQKRDPRTLCRIYDTGPDPPHEQSPTYSVRSASICLTSCLTSHAHGADVAIHVASTGCTLTSHAHGADTELTLSGRCSPVQ